MKIHKEFFHFLSSRAIVFFLFSLFGVSAMGQGHGNHLTVGIGASYPKGFEATLAYEHEMNYHNAMEYFANYYIQYETDPEAGYVTTKSFWHSCFLSGKGRCDDARQGFIPYRWSHRR